MSLAAYASKTNKADYTLYVLCMHNSNWEITPRTVGSSCCLR